MAAVALESDGAGGWDFELSIEHLAVAGAMRNSNHLAGRPIAPVASWAHESGGEIHLPYGSIKTIYLLKACY